MKKFLLIPLAAACSFAQPVIAPTNEQTGNPRGDNTPEYNIIQSFELGYRFVSTGGDTGMYDSTVNYRNGIRLLASSLVVQSRDGQGRFFDHLLITTQGLGNDPYQSAVLRVEKNRLYRYGMIWRLTQYVDPALTVSYGEHAMNTTRTMQDHDFTLFPDRAFQLFLGYSRNLETGPALTTIQLFNEQGDEYPLFANVHRQVNEYRLGGELHVLGMRIHLMHGWENYKENSPQSLTAPSAGNNTTDLNTLTSFQSTQPIHGTSPYWRVGLFREGGKYWAVNGRFTYVAGKNAFSLDELAAGTAFRGGATQQIVTYGNADRPALTANLTVTLFPSDHIDLTNQTSFSNIRMIGNAYFTEFVSGFQASPVLPFQYLGIHTLSNSTDLLYHPSKWLSIHGGFEYSDRHIGSVQGQSNLGDPPPTQEAIEQTNQLKAGTLGFRLKPLKGFTISVDGEVGRENKPIYPISDGNYQAFRARVEYRTKLLRLDAYAKSDYNINSDALTSYASHARQYGADASWTPLSWFAIDASYAKLHLTTLGGINYFAKGKDVSGDSSYYISNIHSAVLGARFAIRKRVDLYMGYSHIQDVGDGRTTPYGAGLYTSSPAFQAVQSFPLRYLSPQFRLSIRINPKLRWNAGYQYYGYREQFSALQNYLANTGYSSLAFSF
ncbi:MAG TPA: hypothetical protein VMT15_12270 [Bryobacteraceae bacterium]|nr:hypothetical protein [Bryobacteraceae bacterium]